MNNSLWLDATLLLVLFWTALIMLSGRRIEDNGLALAGSGFAEQDKSGFGLPGLTAYPRKLVRQAGIVPQHLNVIYWLGKLLLAALLPLIAMEAAVEFIGQPLPIGLITILAIFGFFWIDLWLIRRRRKRRRQIERSLSYFLDLMVAYLLSGMNLQQAFQRAGQHGFPTRHPLAEEVKLIAYELANGRDRDTAFRALAERTGVTDCQRLAAAMGVGMRLGGSIRETLEGQSDLLRAKRWQEGLKLINRKMLESLLPLFLIGFPIFLVLVFFPALVDLFNTFAMFREFY